MKIFYLFLASFLLFACTIPSPSTSAPELILGEQILDETFSQSGGWSLYATSTVTATVTDGVYRMLLQQPNQYVWGTNNTRYNDTVIEVDVTWQSDNPNAFAGMVCRLSPDDSRGYYVVVSKSGDFSIRYIGRNVDDALIPWRNSPQIPRQSTFQMRVVCVDEFIGLYINDNYIDGSRDSRLSRGQLGLAVGMPQTVSGDGIALVDFDNLRVWDASFDD
ncbi:MAG: hypothetical protein AAF846_26785 [Chloroflexota bacterium]